MLWQAATVVAPLAVFLAGAVLVYLLMLLGRRA